MRYLFKLLVVISLGLLASCSSSSSSKSLEQQQILRVNLFQEPPNIDPRQTNDLTSSIVDLMLFEGLTRFDENSVPQLALAQSIDVSKDGLTYTIKLKPSYWSDGSALTAQDFIYSWTTTLDPKFISGYAYQLYVIKNAEEVKDGKLPSSQLGISAPDDMTLVVQLVNPTPYFMQLLAIQTFFPVCQKAVQANDNWAANAGPQFISNGPFNLVEWKHTSDMVMQKNPKYWDAAAVKLAEIRCVIVNDSNTELSMFQAGELDWAGMPMSPLPTEAIASLKQDNLLRSFDVASTVYLLVEVNQAPMGNQNLRRALGLAINRNAIVTNVTQLSEKPNTGIVPLSMGLQKAPYFQDGDVAGAQKLFNQVLMDMKITKDQLPKITLIYNSSEVNQLVAQAIQEQWFKAFGIMFAIQTIDWKTYLQQLQQEQYQIARMGWAADYLDPIDFLQVFETTSSDSSNYTGWHSDQFQALLVKAQQTVDLTARNALMAQAEALLIEQMPAIPLYDENFSYVKNATLQNVILTQMGLIDFKTANFNFSAPTTSQ